MPSFISFACQSCQARVMSAPQFAGLPGPCPACGVTITIPVVSPPAAPPPRRLTAGSTELLTWPTRLPPADPSVPG